MAAPPLAALSSLAQTLLIPLYLRARETQRPDALVRDERAAALVQQLNIAPAEVADAQVEDEMQVALLLRSREFDRRARTFLAHGPGAVVVHLGCGLDQRFERVDDGQVEWYDLDLPEVIGLRRQLLGAGGPRQHLVAGSALDPAWHGAVTTRPGQPVLLLAEGLFMFFTAAQAQACVAGCAQRFAGAELLFDAFSPFLVWANNRRVARTGRGARCAWGLRDPRELEHWGPGAQLLDAWYPLEQPTPRLARVRWVRWWPALTRGLGVYRYQLPERLEA